MAVNAVRAGDQDRQRLGPAGEPPSIRLFGHALLGLWIRRHKQQRWEAVVIPGSLAAVAIPVVRAKLRRILPI
jgi:hypothetical protein